MKSNFIKSKIFILTENADGELYSIETDEYNDIVNDWYGDCKFIPATFYKFIAFNISKSETCLI